MTIELPSWRDEDVARFDATVLAAAGQLGVLPLAVEKDYWVCRALAALAASHPGQFVFKGGTSLEKLRIVQRFSEDLDLLVVGAYPSQRAAQRARKEMVTAVAGVLGGTSEKHRSGGQPGTYHRAEYGLAPLAASAGRGIADPGRILIELGQSGGSHPNAPVAVTSLLARQLQDAGEPIEDWVDLAPIEIPILHPGRTLLEKLLRVNNYAVAAGQGGAGDAVHGAQRVGRQFYDVWALLGDPAVVAFLEDRDLAAATLADIRRVSEQFTPDDPVPSDGFAASPTFAAEGPLADDLRDAHRTAMDDLYYGRDPAPSFEDVLARVASCRPLLDLQS